jgi:spore coat protein A, manganese oxidase
MVTRRELLQRGAIGGASIAFYRISIAAAKPASGGVSPQLRKWVEPLRIPPVLDGTAGGAHLTIAAAESTTYRFHRDLGEARTWGYGGAPYLGPTIQARRLVPLQIEWRNNLDRAFLPNDPTIMGAVMPGEAPPIVAHLHGGENLPQCDGTPLQWFTKSGQTGPHFVTRDYLYTNEQRATMVWYHDHALGNTRTNVYAGLAGIYLIRDEFDTGAADNPLGVPAGPYEIPLVLQDKILNGDGTMFYPSQGVTSYHPVWVPEFFGDVAIVNGKAWPVLDVEPRRYRLRLVNGSQARFYRLQFANEQSGRPLDFTQIGAEGGLLREPVTMHALVLAPGERADLIVDFAGKRNASFVVTNNARAPYPSGDRAGLSQLLKIRVSTPLSGRDVTTPGPEVELPEIDPLPAPSVVRTQDLTETIDEFTGEPIGANVEGEPYLDKSTGLPGVTTMPHANAVEDWLFVNHTGDTHPIHLHLVTFEVLDRTPIDGGTSLPRYPNENGLKDTVQCPPGWVTRIRAKFVMPDEQIILPAGLSNPQYVWHCHILEHEENDMMRAFEVVS